MRVGVGAGHREHVANRLDAKVDVAIRRDGHAEREPHAAVLLVGEQILGDRTLRRRRLRGQRLGDGRAHERVCVGTGRPERLRDAGALVLREEAARDVGHHAGIGIGRARERGADRVARVVRVRRQRGREQDRERAMGEHAHLGIRIVRRQRGQLPRQRRVARPGLVLRREGLLARPGEPPGVGDGPRAQVLVRLDGQRHEGLERALRLESDRRVGSRDRRDGFLLREDRQEVAVGAALAQIPERVDRPAPDAGLLRVEEGQDRGREALRAGMPRGPDRQAQVVAAPLEERLQAGFDARPRPETTERDGRARAKFSRGVGRQESVEAGGISPRVLDRGDRRCALVLGLREDAELRLRGERLLVGGGRGRRRRGGHDEEDERTQAVSGHRGAPGAGS